MAKIVSGLLLTAFLFLTLFLGEKFSFIVIGILGLIIIDEIHVQFFKRTRFEPGYWASVVLYLGVYLPQFFGLIDGAAVQVVNGLALCADLALVFYLFLMPMHSQWPHQFKRFSFLSGPLIGLQLFALCSLVGRENWRILIFLLLLINFGMDTFAWFFGKTWGKHKLWPEVSPNKTLEGLIGGTVGATFAAAVYWYAFGQNLSVGLVLAIAFWAICAQVGDLIESKFKRQCGIKDSSGLIPGHGGVYDRIDSLLFLAPVFATTLRYFYN